MGEVVAFIYLSIFFIVKAAIDGAYFKDQNAAKRSLKLWGVSSAALCFSFVFSLLFDRFG